MTPSQLAEIVGLLAARPGAWMARVRLREDGRWYERLHCGADYDVWLIAWLPGQATGFHDHGASSGAFAVASGSLEEHRPGQGVRVVHPGECLSFGPSYAHDVRNASSAPAISIHAYSPPLTEMTEYELDGAALVPRVAPPVAGENAREPDRAKPGEAAPQTGEHGGNGAASLVTVLALPRSGVPIARTGRDGVVSAGRAVLTGENLTQNQAFEAIKTASGAAWGIDDVLAMARARLHRLSPLEAHEAMVVHGALLVDIRPAAQREREGAIPEAVVIERNVLEWRFDPRCEARLAAATGYDVQVIVLCSEGYTSSLAAAALQDLGLWRATDVIGGFHAWRAAGLTTSPASKMA